MSDTFTIGTTSDLVAEVNLGKQCRTILTHLKDPKFHGTITNLEAMTVYHVSRLSDVIMKLRRKGYDITTTIKEDGVGGKYASYKLVEKTAVAA